MPATAAAASAADTAVLATAFERTATWSSPGRFIANGTEFGLVAAVFTADSERLIRVAKAISASVVFLNHYSRAGLFGTPFGGTKHSGYGRLHAQQTLSEFGYAKSLRLPTGTGPIDTLDFFGANAFD
jgi:hypothetical protein